MKNTILKWKFNEKKQSDWGWVINQKIDLKKYKIIKKLKEKDILKEMIKY